MGVDCMVFAKRSKKCIWVDRWYNLGSPPNNKSHSGDWWLGYMEALDLASREGGIWQSNDGSVSECGWAGESAIANRRTARDFIERHGVEDEYFIITDHSEPTCHEYAHAHGYVAER